VTADASAVGECYPSPAVDSQTIILVGYVGIADCDIVAVAYVEGIRIMSQTLAIRRLCIARAVVDRNVVQSQAFAIADAESVYRLVDECEATDVRLREFQAEEFGLVDLAALIAADAVPVLVTVAIDLAARRADNFDVGARDADERLCATWFRTCCE
jgi:hypothetical protein